MKLLETIYARLPSDDPEVQENMFCFGTSFLVCLLALIMGIIFGPVGAVSVVFFVLGTIMLGVTLKMLIKA